MVVRDDDQRTPRPSNTSFGSTFRAKTRKYEAALKYCVGKSASSDLKSPVTTWAVLKTPPARIQASK
jgi:hypothetical protein